ncbi:MAG: hypothetical protein V8T87_17255 [Victivallales bacterium]
MPGYDEFQSFRNRSDGTFRQGAEIVFDKEYEFITSTPLRYRSIAAAMSSFNLKLPVVWKKGMEYHLSYTMKIIP